MLLYYQRKDDGSGSDLQSRKVDWCEKRFPSLIIKLIKMAWLSQNVDSVFDLVKDSLCL